MGVWARGAWEKIWDPLFISATSNWVHNLGLGISLLRKRFRNKIGGGLG